MSKKKEARRNKIRKKIRAKINGTAERPRLSVYRSNKDIYAQIIDDTKGITLLAVSSRDIKAGTKIEQSLSVGKSLGEKAKSAGITQVVFDRNGYLYHGRIKNLAEGAREAGLVF